MESDDSNLSAEMFGGFFLLGATLGLARSTQENLLAIEFVL